MAKRTKIVCTIGPASESREVLGKMISVGMNVARLNFSHGVYKNHAKLIKNIRAAAGKCGRTVAILQDLQGPRIRTGVVPEAGISLEVGEEVVLVAEGKKHEDKKVVKALPIQYPQLAKVVKKGSPILISDGLIELKVLRSDKKKLLTYCRVLRGGVVLSHRGMNIPKSNLSVAVITAKDREDLKFGLKQGIDWVALSFVRAAKDVIELKHLIQHYQPGSRVKVIAKIERQQAVDNLAEILKVVDGVMVARGDLGIELPPQQIPLLQKRIIADCLLAAKPVIVATQMMESMMTNPRPTRAEVSDVANAVIDHTDAVMLSGETATGKYPVEALELMTKTVSKTEQSPYDDLRVDLSNGKSLSVTMAATVANLAEELSVKNIFVMTADGQAARLISRFRPESRIIALTSDPTVKRQLALSWGVEGVVFDIHKRSDKLFKLLLAFIHRYNLAKPGEKVIFVAGGSKESLDAVRVIEV